MKQAIAHGLHAPGCDFDDVHRADPGEKRDARPVGRPRRKGRDRPLYVSELPLLTGAHVPQPELHETTAIRRVDKA